VDDPPPITAEEKELARLAAEEKAAEVAEAIANGGDALVVINGEEGEGGEGEDGMTEEERLAVEEEANKVYGCMWERVHAAGMGDGEWNDPPTPSVRERDACKVALRTLRLAQRARRRALPQACECGRMIPGNWMHIHKQVRTPLPLGASVDRHSQRPHSLVALFLQTCGHRIVSCRNPECKYKCQARMLMEHMTGGCEWARSTKTMAWSGQRQYAQVMCPLCDK
jgi:hypothetical protein